MKRLSGISAFLVSLLLTACVPSERFWWSPDGSRAAVNVGEDLWVVDETGTVLESEGLSREGSKSTRVETISWHPDGSSFLADRIFVFGSWEIARPQFPTEEAERIEVLSSSIPALLEAAVALGGDAKNFDALLARLKADEPALVRNAFHLALETGRGGIESALAGAPDVLATLDSHLPEADGIILHRVDRIHFGPDNNFGEIETLVRTATPLEKPLFSPDRSRLAFGRQRSEKGLIDIEVRSAEEGSERKVAKRVHPTFAWTPDGGSIFITGPMIGDDGLLRQVQRIQVDGGEESEESPVENLATALMPFAPRVECLPDGSVLFAAQESALPTTHFEVLPSSSLYRLRPDTGELVRIPTADGALPANLGHFVCSPDGRHAALVESDTDAVAVVDLQTGELTVVSPPTPRGKCRTLPAWRNDRELTYAAFDKSGDRVEWRTWTLGGESRVLSADWKDETTADWIETKNEEKPGAGES